MRLVITIDGPSGSGKGTTARGVADRLELPHVDSGSIYRAVAYALNEAEIQSDQDEKIEKFLRSFSLSYSPKGEVQINGENKENEIRSRENSKIAFLYSRNPLIRTYATELQRKRLQHGGVLDGRDAGTIVAPDADLKIYLDCDIEERLRRRIKQHSVTDEDEIQSLRQEIIERDHADSNKGDASLTVLPESVVVDTSGMSVEEQIDAVYQLALSKKEV